MEQPRRTTLRGEREERGQAIVIKKRGRAAKCTTSFFPFIVLAMSLKVITGTFDVAKVLLFYDITKFSEKSLSLLSMKLL